jgi:hypothetical protein
MMNDAGLGIIHGFVLAVYPSAEVGIFKVHKEILVKQTHCFQGFTSYKHKTT